jgi:flagellin
MTVINTNVAATVTANAMKSNQRVMETTMERLATGLRVNSAKDDAAGLAIGTKMESQLRGFGQAVRNANDGISLLQTADGAAEQITGLLQRMRELAVQGQNDTNSTTDLANLNQEFAALATEIDRIADDTEFNGTALMSSASSVVLTVGKDDTDVISVSIGDFNLAAGASSTKSVDTLTITDGDIQALTTDTDAALYITNARGQVLTVTNAQIAATAATSFADATTTTLAAAINAAFGVQTDMDGMAAAANGNSITFTQDTAGTGQIISVSGLTDGVANNAGQIGTGVVRTTNGTSAAGTPMGANLSTYSSASADRVQTSGTISALDAAISGVNSARADFGANISRLSYTVDNLQSAISNTSSAKSAIMDADYAVETTELARTQIIAQASTAMLSQANQQAQSVLALLK